MSKEHIRHKSMHWKNSDIKIFDEDENHNEYPIPNLNFSLGTMIERHSKGLVGSKIKVQDSGLVKDSLSSKQFGLVLVTSEQEKSETQKTINDLS